jgi:long-chain fatty acid transport protein
MSVNLKKLSIAIILAAASTTAMASGFQLWEQDGAGVGDYHAGAAADTDNTGIEFYNPAGMVFMQRKGIQVSGGATLIPVDVKFDGTVLVKNNNSGDTLTTSNTNGWVNGNTFNAVPNFHAVDDINDRVAIGFGITAPFGLATQYDEDSAVSEAATNTEVKTVNFNPNVALKLNRWLSIGGGFDLQYATADFDDIVPKVSNLEPNLPDKNHLTSWGEGYNVGLYAQNTHGTQIGLSYRSKITQDATGTNTTNTLLFGTANSKISATLPLPGTIYTTVVQHIDSKWTVMASAFYTMWDTLKTMTIDNIPNPLDPAQKFALTSAFNYHNTWNFSVGAHYQVRPNLLLKIGGGFDETPTNDADRDIRLPGVNRFAAAAGLRVNMSRNLSFDGGWTHFFPVKKATIDNTGPTGLPLNISVLTNGTAEMSANVIGGQLTYYFNT